MSNLPVAPQQGPGAGLLGAEGWGLGGWELTEGDWG